MVGNFTKRQWLTLIVISIADFANAICVSLQAPFYPREAEKKNASPSEYGLVFGIFELIVFLISPVYGQHLNRIGPKLLFNGGILTTGTCAIFFGLLDKVNGHYPFIILSFIIRILEAFGNAAFLTASFAIIAKEFPENVATTFASLETFFGLGLIVGPTVGGALYQIGGYTLPFAILGSALIVTAIITAFILPSHNDSDQDSPKFGGYTKVLRIPGVLVSTASIMATSMSIGFLQATLEPHLRQFDLSPLVTIIGCILIMIGFSLIGPAPFIPYPTIIWLTICGLVTHGIGLSAQLVAAFSDALQTTIAHGFPNNFETYGLISALWTSSFALGAFIGPSLGGILLDNINFRNASMFIGIAASVFVICCSRNPKPFTEVSCESESRVSLTDSARSHSTSLFTREVDNQNMPVDRPSGMNSLMACNSYSNRAGAWSRASYSGRYSYNYGSLDAKQYLLERTT
ncbi:Similar to Slc18b1: MFS-type transporter SLC18B1 (Mus musculus) [Cotesia congregata]|uniref:Similar to Slc18b1: MFS-type transporter SLC18B1 (Mus musculus) n=1 Tax=Cotesia congregata TaxID=51543 RepID=A0A8J2HQ90_COTCN|nr:Similar to Slc18b1: MFS-type transporter SLC18B1 (Mus musculus) [Cotesia congregata]